MWSRKETHGNSDPFSNMNTAVERLAAEVAHGLPGLPWSFEPCPCVNDTLAVHAPL